jgi:hypothetical protein
MLQAQDPIVMARIRDGLAGIAPAARMHVLDVPPVVGALASALELAGAAPDQVATACGLRNTRQ